MTEENPNALPNSQLMNELSNQGKEVPRSGVLGDILSKQKDNQQESENEINRIIDEFTATERKRSKANDPRRRRNRSEQMRHRMQARANPRRLRPMDLALKLAMPAQNNQVLVLCYVLPDGTPGSSNHQDTFIVTRDNMARVETLFVMYLEDPHINVFARQTREAELRQYVTSFVRFNLIARNAALSLLNRINADPRLPDVLAELPVMVEGGTWQNELEQMIARRARYGHQIIGESPPIETRDLAMDRIIRQRTNALTDVLLNVVNARDLSQHTTSPPVPNPGAGTPITPERPGRSRLRRKE